MNDIEIFSFFGKIVTNSADAERDIKGVTNTAKDSEDKMTKAFSNIGKAIVTAFSVKAIIDFGKKLVESSANIQAMEAQFDQVFKSDNAQAVEGIAKQVDDLGIHADRLTVSWNKFGGQVKGAGMDGEMALTAVDKATRLAADSAAFYDTSLENSSASLASFMKGNFEAGDAIGVFTNAKQMDVKSNEMYGKSWADLTEAERQWLLLDTVEKTYEMNGAMGQATRESGAYENTMGNLNATFERFYAVVGAPVLEGFLVIVQNGTEKVAALTERIQNGESIFNKFGDAVNWVKDNSEILIPILGGVTAAIAAQLIVNTVQKGYAAFKLATEGTTIAQAALNFVMSANPFGVVAIAIGALVAAGVALYKNWDTVVYHVKNALAGMEYTFDTTFSNIKIWVFDSINIIIDKLQYLIGWMPVVGDALDGLQDKANNVINEAQQAKQTATLEYENAKRINSLNLATSSIDNLGKTSKEQNDEMINDMRREKSERADWAKSVNQLSQNVANTVVTNNETMKSSSQSFANTIADNLQKISSRINSATDFIYKKLELWRLQNDLTAESNEYLTEQLKAQQQEQDLLTQEITATEQALAKATEQYGIGSDEVLNYKNKLLDLQIEQSKLTGSIDETTKALDGMVKIQARIAAYDKQNYSSSGSSVGNSRESSRYLDHKEQRENFYSANKDEIDAISRRQDVDLGVAQDMYRQNLIDKIPKYANGTNFHPGGLAWVGELGKELINIPKGTQVIPNQQSEDMLKQGDTIIHVHNPQPSPAALARQIKKAQQELALGF